MKVYVGLTDSNWITRLSARGDGGQANFWFPSPEQAFRALDHGGVFLFKAKAAAGAQIVGGAIFDTYVRARVTDAWEWFGPDNGVATLDELRARVRHYRRLPGELPHDAEIGCVMLSFVDFSPRARGSLHHRIGHPTSFVAGRTRRRTCRPITAWSGL